MDHVTRILPGSPEFADLLAQIAAGAKDRDLNDENPFDQVSALKRAGFGSLRLPEHLGGVGFTVPHLFSAVIDVAQADPIVAHIFRTHFWFVEERLRTAGDVRAQQWLRKFAEGRIVATTTDHDSVATVVVPADREDASQRLTSVTS